jgi:predicted dinucleotide-binding enzyme
MSYAIVGFGKIGEALAHAFAPRGATRMRSSPGYRDGSVLLVVTIYAAVH